MRRPVAWKTALAMAGATPTIVYGWRSIEMLVPMIPGSEWKCVRQNWYEMTASVCDSSVAVSNRPAAGTRRRDDGLPSVLRRRAACQQGQGHAQATDIHTPHGSHPPLWDRVVSIGRCRSIRRLSVCRANPHAHPGVLAARSNFSSERGRCKSDKFGP